MEASFFQLNLSPQTQWGRGSASFSVTKISQWGRRVFLVHGSAFERIEWFYNALIAEGLQIERFTCAQEPTLDLVERGSRIAREFSAEVIVAIGGGAVIDCAKGIAGLAPASGALLDYLEVVGSGKTLETQPLPLIALPTTAGTGAEATANAVIDVPAAARKVSLRDRRLLPQLAVIDPGLTDGCPAQVTLASGLDAITQVIEPYVSGKANRFSDALCRAAIPLGLSALQRLMTQDSRNARDDMAWCSYCGGVALANAGLGAVHGLAGPLGGVMHGPHGAIAGRLLPAVLAENSRQAVGLAQDRLREVQQWLGDAFDVSGSDAIKALEAWIDRCGLPRLGEMGLKDEQIVSVAEAAAESSSMRGNPVPLTKAQLINILQCSI
ncbi:iron-containing alcohol dehydrogenase [Spiribacter sp. C176]|uniref:Iron-containing alcohol dehydrogenase n=1 Tax=Spiribacter salilacus TaxID=2664894 RepID=A0A6N7QWV1_9GAMM|nr:iron-containing alcohol dehydrogenase [Spiribacter salilacus]MRH77134.1 iron-containing alcohol dehydrogenase [Spiribacter salilacus]